MKQVLNTFIVMIVVLPFTGCYTELATVERNDREYAYDPDTTAGGNGTTVINNNYYLDDSYRQSRMRVSFNYYYPSYSSWIGSYYHSYFDDYYWGMNYRPSWYYDPFYTYYPPFGGCQYPSPYYDPWYPYYTPIAYYPVYYPVYTPPIYGGNSGNPNRPRDGGATRDPLDGGRSRPIPGPVNTPVAVTDNPENRPRTPDDAVPTGRPVRTQERPWWEKMDDRSSRPAGDSRPVEVSKGSRPSRDESSPVTPTVNERPVRNPEDRPVDRNKPNQPTYAPGKTDRQPEARPAERPRRDEVRYSQPAKPSSTQQEARPVERSRESSRPSFTPAPQSAPPQSSAPRSGGGSSGGGGRRRD